MQIFTFLKHLALVSVVVAQDWSGSVIKGGKKRKILCGGFFVADNWFLTDSSCLLDETRNMIRNRGVNISRVVRTERTDDAILVKTEFPEAPETVVLASQEFPYESEGQTVQFSYRRGGKPRVKKWELRLCPDGICIGEGNSGGKCKHRRGFPVEVENDEKPTVMGFIKGGGCISKKSVFYLTPVRGLRDWVESVTGETLEESPQLCN